ncbi:3'-5' exonuclease [Flavobacterium sp. xlx-214]|uniref:3'-5' exonuclease n=1 Tax=unclassified Flavobacterium TaxID=196869 RepID=UPI0013D5BA3E|nr:MULTISPECIES: 3'-5' exonuclease [unclassified Flavobacterium]MBA5792950.1 3'-5' exonuclease [Flavobacterium sp. xlx-221]QMI84716.1 3'-5' exonuclease [Flavobacterium sp. xlx-214]
MIDKIVLPNILFFDIETVPQQEFFSDLPEETQQLYADKTQYQRKDDVTAEEFYERAGIWAEFGKIVCISVGFFTIKNAERQFRTKSIIGDEKNLLMEFNQLIQTHFSNPAYVFCGHNIKEFDIPYVCRRMLIHGLPIPEKLQLFGRKPWEIPHLDTLELWKFGDYKHYTSLKLLTSVLGIPSPKEDIDGSEVRNVYYNEKNINRISKYCERDVVAVAQVFLRLRGDEILNETEILSTTN